MYLSISGVSSKLWQSISIKPKVLEALGPHLCVDSILTSLAIERLYHAMKKNMDGENTNLQSCLFMVVVQASYLMVYCDLQCELVVTGDLRCHMYYWITTVTH